MRFFAKLISVTTSSRGAGTNYFGLRDDNPQKTTVILHVLYCSSFYCVDASLRCYQSLGKWCLGKFTATQLRDSVGFEKTSSVYKPSP